MFPNSKDLCFKKRTCLESHIGLVTCCQKPDLLSGKGRLSRHQELECTVESCGYCPDTSLKDKALGKERAAGEGGWVCILEQTLWPQMTEQLRSMAAGVCRNFREKGRSLTRAPEALSTPNHLCDKTQASARQLQASWAPIQTLCPSPRLACLHSRPRPAGSPQLCVRPCPRAALSPWKRCCELSTEDQTAPFQG